MDQTEATLETHSHGTRRKDTTKMHSTDSLGEIPLFKGLPEKVLAKLEGHSSIKRIEEGETYFRVGDLPRHLAIVVSGQLKAYRVNKAGKEQVFGYAQPHDVIGIVALTDPYRASLVDCVARASTEVVEIELATLREIMKSEPQLSVALMGELARYFMRMVQLVDQLSLKDAHNRLAHWLENWITRNYPDSGDKELMLVLPYTQSEIAAQIGTVREVVSRGFSKMEKDGILKTSGKRVTIQSRARLRDMANV